MSELGYDAAGAGDPALLFLHGWCGDRTFFAPQFNYFSETHRVVAVDLPGHGQSDVPEEYAIEAFASDVAELVSGLHLGRSVVFGHSIGAMVALAVAQQTPELVGAVAMIDPPPLSKEVSKGFAAQLIPSFQGPDGPAGRRRFVEQMFLPTDDSARRAQIIKTMTAVSNDIAIPLVRAMAAFDAMAALRECAVPVLTISSAVPTNDTATLLEAKPTMTLGQTVGAGHFLQLEVPEQVNDDRAVPGSHPGRFARAALTLYTSMLYAPVRTAPASFTGYGQTEPLEARHHQSTRLAAHPSHRYHVAPGHGFR